MQACDRPRAPLQNDAAARVGSGAPLSPIDMNQRESRLVNDSRSQYWKPDPYSGRVRDTWNPGCWCECFISQ